MPQHPVLLAAAGGGDNDSCMEYGEQEDEEMVDGTDGRASPGIDARAVERGNAGASLVGEDGIPSSSNSLKGLSRNLQGEGDKVVNISTDITASQGAGPPPWPKEAVQQLLRWMYNAHSVYSEMRYVHMFCWSMLTFAVRAVKGLPQEEGLELDWKLRTGPLKDLTTGEHVALVLGDLNPEGMKEGSSSSSGRITYSNGKEGQRQLQVNKEMFQEEQQQLQQQQQAGRQAAAVVLPAAAAAVAMRSRR